MNTDFWLERWREGHTGFHQNRISPLLQKYWPALKLPRQARVLVPLCGKSQDMLWLAEQGHQVLGVELSPLAVQQFFEENGKQPAVHNSELGSHYTAGNIEIICGDIFALSRSVLETCAGVYDRAALIALPSQMRADYVNHVYGQLSNHYHGLLLTLDYPQEQMEGPPFSVDDTEVQSLYADHSQALILDRRDILEKEPKFAERGLTRLETVTYLLGRKAAKRTV